MSAPTRTNVVRIDFRSDPLSPGPERTPRRRPAGVREASAPVAAPRRWMVGLAIPGRRWAQGLDGGGVNWPARRTCLHGIRIAEVAGRDVVQWCVLPPRHTGTHLPAPSGAR